jgi:hypothetical protein
MGSHDKTWLIANGGDGERYWAYCRKYSDVFETAFKAQVRARTGDCRTVHWSSSEPSNGTEIEI